MAPYGCRLRVGKGCVTFSAPGLFLNCTIIWHNFCCFYKKTELCLPSPLKKGEESKDDTLAPTGVDRGVCVCAQTSSRDDGFLCFSVVTQVRRPSSLQGRALSSEEKLYAP